MTQQSWHNCIDRIYRCDFFVRIGQEFERLKSSCQSFLGSISFIVEAEKTLKQTFVFCDTSIIE